MIVSMGTLPSYHPHHSRSTTLGGPSPIVPAGCFRVGHCCICTSANQLTPLPYSYHTSCVGALVTTPLWSCPLPIDGPSGVCSSWGGVQSQLRQCSSMMSCRYGHQRVIQLQTEPAGRAAPASLLTMRAPRQPRAPPGR